MQDYIKIEVTKKKTDGSRKVTVNDERKEKNERRRKWKRLKYQEIRAK